MHRVVKTMVNFFFLCFFMFKTFATIKIKKIRLWQPDFFSDYPLKQSLYQLEILEIEIFGILRHMRNLIYEKYL